MDNDKQKTILDSVMSDPITLSFPSSGMERNRWYRVETHVRLTDDPEVTYRANTTVWEIDEDGDETVVSYMGSPRT